MKNRWKDIWSAREIDSEKNKDEGIQKQLLFLDGMDTDYGRVSARSWQSYVARIMEGTNIDNNSEVFEVGCGAGAFLYPIYSSGVKVGGSDYSEKLVQYAARFMPLGSFQLADAADTISGSYSHVVSSGVFLYFPGLEYAKKVLSRMYEASNEIVAILDIPDVRKKNEAETMRQQLYSGDDYVSRYSCLSHQYYDRSWFAENLSELGCTEINILDQEIDGYPNGVHRFNVTAHK